ncbi:tRNA (guanosine(37)-N1)-methyltransferase TrmD [Jannaschia sp. CCS1]|nr:tRNA (guanosine(37)-N1)-methyltransferase TrmD [Jannaschia sp. CCS1]ABD53661.1 tRNA (Guanine37-N(1)-) methyltransferase [Jannaschia sp. CCS1]
MTQSPSKSSPSKSHGRLSQSASLKPRELMTEHPRLAKAWCAKVITLFPETFPGVLGASLTGKALQKGLWALEPIDLRTFGTGKHRQVDDTPAGGGAGLVLKPDVMARALDIAARGTPADRADWPIVYLSPRGKPFEQRDAERFASAKGITLVCGRFEGVDQRVIDAYGMEEICVGDAVLTGGEIAAQLVLDATTRLIPGVLGNADSTQEESFSDGLLEHPQYTKPADWRGHTIPPVLLSGDHGKVAEWRKAQAEALTQERRPDLWVKVAKPKKPR